LFVRCAVGEPEFGDRYGGDLHRSAWLQGHESPVFEQRLSCLVEADTASSEQKDIYHLRDVFGAICPQLEITSLIEKPQWKIRRRYVPTTN
jgi:hypothetical protein